MLMGNDKLYSGINRPVLDCIPATARRVLDLGCGTGALAEALKRRTASVAVVGVTYSEAEAAAAAPRLDEVRVADLNDFDFQGLGTFDCAVLSHVLEHLYHPANVLARLRGVLAPDAVVVVALPNILMLRQRLQFLLGRFRYQDYGVMDRTHYRFFDTETAAALLRDAGYRLVGRADEGHLPLPLLRRLLGGAWAGAVDRFATRARPGLFADQFVLIAQPAPAAGGPVPA